MELINTTNENTASNDNSFELFCQMLGAEKERVSFRVIAESPKTLARCVKIGYPEMTIKVLPDGRSWKDRMSELYKANAKEFGIFWLPSRCEYLNGSTEEKEPQIAAYRAMVLDLDKAPIGPVLDWEVYPSLIIQTSPGRYQCIWWFDQEILVKDLPVKGSCRTPGFNELAVRLAIRFGGDSGVAKATQIFRAPGFKHWKTGTPFLSHVIGTAGKTLASFIINTVSFEQLKTAILRPIVVDKGSNGVNRDAAEGLGGAGGGLRGEGLDDGPKMDLEAFRTGEVMLLKGDRHEGILRFASLLSYEDKNRSLQEIREIIESKLRNGAVENGEVFLEGGDRRNEFERILRDTKKYAETAAKNKEIKQVALEKEEVLLQEGFQYDWNEGTLKTNRYTDTAVAQRVLQRFRKDLAKVDGKIFCFHNGKSLWLPQNSIMHPEVRARVIRVVEDMLHEPDFVDNYYRNAKGEIQEHKKQTVHASKLSAGAIMRNAQSVMNDIAVPEYKSGDFDANDDLFYAKNGVVNLVSSHVRKAKNEDKLLRQSEFIDFEGTDNWNASHCQGWIDFLHEVFAENEDSESMCNFMQELFGYSLGGSILETKVFCHYGSGANGKSLVLEALKTIAGSYATVLIGGDVLRANKGGYEKDFERVMSKIEGSRIAITDDLDVISKWNEGFVKSLTGTPTRARAEYQVSRVIENHCKFHFGLNRVPEPEAENEGILRRICIIPYNRSFRHNVATGEKIRAIIKTEAADILIWAQIGYARRAKRIKDENKGLIYPNECLAATEAYRQENFKVETSLRELYEPSTPNNEENSRRMALWVPLYKIHETVTKHLGDRLPKEGVSEAELGKVLKGNLQWRQEKRWCLDRKAMCSHYLLIPKMDNPKATDLV